VDKVGQTPLHFAAGSKTDATATVRVLVDVGGAKVDETDNLGETALHVAAARGHAATARTLMEYGAKATKGNNWKQTPLHKAAFKGDPEMVRLLVEVGGADVDGRDMDGWTPLRNAMRSPEAVEVLRELGAGKHPNPKPQSSPSLPSSS